MKKRYCCDDSRELYERYYDNQQRGKGEFPVYVGRYAQRGHGIGNILGSLFRRILPALKAIAPRVLRTGANVLEDVTTGRSWKEAVVKRIPEVKETVLEAIKGTQSGSGKQKRVSSGKRAVKRRRDIFA
jgi:hypothetical protein